jgi:outer membrane protein OmpA-like peptidoglycan-associated protein/tetratricopeptide (TPR) repeat protein/protocatechuate 3,4-dioxygenase beta subunit
MKKAFLFLLLFAFTCAMVGAQDRNITFTPQNFVGQEQSLNQARSLLREADNLLKQGEKMLKNRVSDVRYNTIAKDKIRKALEFLLKANVHNPDNARLNYGIGKSYLYLNLPEDAIPFLLKAANLSKKNFGDINFMLGQAYHLKGDFSAAIRSYDEAISKTKDLDDIDKLKLLINQAKYAQNMINAPLDILVENMGTAVNTQYPEYLPIVTENDNAIIFQRYNNEGNDLYVTFNQGKNWSQALPTGQKFNLNINEFFKAITLVDNNHNAITTRLFYIDYPFGEKNYLYETAVSVSSDGLRGYLTSSRNMYDAAGNGSAIFETRRNPRGQWIVRPRTLGLKLSSSDEFGVVLHPNGKILYFSSRGPQTIGGFDIYKSIFNGTQWSKPENMGYPVNSTGDDIIYGISEDGNKLYISSNRSGGYGDHDLYVVTIMPGYTPPAIVPPTVTADGKPQPAEPVTSEPKVQYPAAFRGFVTDEVTYKPLKEVPVIIKDANTNEEEIITTDETGMFQTTLTAGAAYEIQVNQPGYVPYAEQMPIADGRGQKVSKYIKLSPVSAATTVASAEELDDTSTAPVVSLQPNLATVEGRLLDVNNKPVADATVIVTDDVTQQSQQVTTGADGYFSTKIPSTHPYTLSVQEDGYQPSITKVAPNQQLASVITLKPATATAFVTTVEGHLVDANNKPVANAIVAVTDSVTNKTQQLKTNAQGYFKTMIPAGNAYTVSIADTKYEPFVAEVKADEKLPAVIALKAAAATTVAETIKTVEGRVVGANNQPLANVPVVVTDAVTKQAQKVTTDAKGNFKTTIPAGNAYTVSITDTKHEPFVAEVKADEKLPAVIALKAAAATTVAETIKTVEGRVVGVNNQPLANVPVVVTDAVTKQAQKVTTDAKGNFKTTIPAGNAYTVTITDTKYEPFVAEVKADEKLPAVIALKAAAATTVAETIKTVEGRVVGANNQPLANVPVVVTDAVTKQAQKVTTDAKGNFKTTIPAGNAYTVSITDTKHEPFVAEVKADEKLPAVIALKAAAATTVAETIKTVEGRVVGANNQPLANVPVVVTDAVTKQAQKVTTDAKGNFKTTIPAGNAYTVTITDTKYEPFVAEVKADEKLPAVIALKAAAATTVAETIKTVEGRVVGVNNQPLANVPVVVTDAVTKQAQKVTTDAKGNFKTTIPAGNAYTVTITDTKHEPFVAEVKADEKLPTVIALKAAAATTVAGRVVGTNNQPLANVPVVVTDAVTKQAQKVTTDAKGNFKTTIPAGNAYTVSITDTKHEPFVAEVEAGKKLASTITLKPKDTKLAATPQKPAAAKRLVLTIYFNLDRANLTDEEMRKIHDIASSLKASEQLELVGYTDEVGGEGYNSRLTHRRMDAIITSLKTDGVLQKITTSYKHVPAHLKTSHVISTRKENNRVEVWVK